MNYSVLDRDTGDVFEYFEPEIDEIEAESLNELAKYIAREFFKKQFGKYPPD